MVEDPLDKIVGRIDARMIEFEKKMDKIAEGIPPPFPEERPETSITKPIDDISEKMSDIGERILDPARDINTQVTQEMDRVARSGRGLFKSLQTAMFPSQAVANPISILIFAKNAKENPNMRTDDLVEMTNKEVLEWVLDAANIAWPGTAAPNAKDDVKDKVGGLVESFSGVNIFK